MDSASKTLGLHGQLPHEKPETGLKMMVTPHVRIEHVPAKEGDVYKIGSMVLRIIEDVSRTGTRFLFFALRPNNRFTNNRK